ncbi:uncharacterized protein LOC127291551 [Leptopilina boulardi]|uniref:uncharacterized protein LOC127291551 n=1 Tax=Leptopilina boulardi TaxID=63433 RepID=UPI0021F55772|nr:uncharacterized protein LOC127291551 [Leptopilina boulardi]
MVRIFGDENEQKRQIAILRRESLNHLPEEVQAESRVCFNCNISIDTEIRMLEEDPNCLRLNVVKLRRINVCIFCNNVQNLTRLSTECRIKVFVLKRIFMPESVRCCDLHLDENGFIPRLLMNGLQFVNRPYRLDGRQVQEILEHLCDSSSYNGHDFNDEESFSKEEFKSFSPITREQFHHLYTNYIVPVPEPGRNTNRNVSKKHLLTFLCKLRQNLSDDFLKVTFNYTSRQAVSLVISTVRKSLMIRFVPRNIGLNAITRQQYIENHVTEFSNSLYNPDPNVPVAIAIIDGTYVYTQKPTNFQAQRQSYSLHKGDQLVKPALIVAPDGYILDIHGPYFSDSRNNDAAMLANEMEVGHPGLRDWFREGDIILVDRGYRDALPLLENLGINHKMPAFLERGQRQFDTLTANESRLITKSRWMVEAKNGHFKTVFKFFQGTVTITHVIHIGDFYKIAGAILNAYRDTIHMAGANRQLAEQMLEKSRRPNAVQERVQLENLERRNALWIRLNVDQVPHFPRLTLEYLQDLTVGVYQVKLSPGYIQDKVIREENEEFQIDEHFNEIGFIRIRIYSRFRNATRYQIFITFNPEYENDDANENANEPILGYYCTCKTGARTLGCCSHVASVLWLLGYAIHQPVVKYPSTALLENISDAAHRN